MPHLQICRLQVFILCIRDFFLRDSESHTGAKSTISLAEVSGQTQPDWFDWSTTSQVGFGHSRAVENKVSIIFGLYIVQSWWDEPKWIPGALWSPTVLVPQAFWSPNFLEPGALREPKLCVPKIKKIWVSGALWELNVLVSGALWQPKIWVPRALWCPECSQNPGFQFWVFCVLQAPETQTVGDCLEKLIK